VTGRTRGSGFAPTIDQLNARANLTGSKSSWCDCNLDGFTNQNHVPYILGSKFPRNCPTSKS
jgi:hypothetical protein